MTLRELYDKALNLCKHFTDTDMDSTDKLYDFFKQFLDIETPGLDRYLV